MVTIDAAEYTVEHEEEPKKVSRLTITMMYLRAIWTVMAANIMSMMPDTNIILASIFGWTVVGAAFGALAGSAVVGAVVYGVIAAVSMVVVPVLAGVGVTLFGLAAHLIDRLRG